MDEFHEWVAERDKNRTKKAEGSVVKMHESA